MLGTVGSPCDAVADLHFTSRISSQRIGYLPAAMLLVSLFILFENYALTISLFERALALHNFIAFASFYTQWRGEKTHAAYIHGMLDATGLLTVFWYAVLA